jgi:CBS domain containing-hemolysin-like protein
MKGSKRWIITITCTSIATSMVFSLVSSQALGSAGYIAAISALVIFISLGIVFDMIGVAVTSASEAPFHSMAAHRERGAAEAIRLVKNAGKVSSVCNDVVGDIVGIISGTTAALVAERLSMNLSVGEVLIQLLLTGAVTGATIGGKAAGKLIAISRTNEILLRIGKIISVFSRG